MDSEETQIKLKELSANVNELLSRFQSLQADHHIALQENKKLKSLLEEKNQQLNDFQYKAKISKKKPYSGEQLKLLKTNLNCEKSK